LFEKRSLGYTHNWEEEKIFATSITWHADLLNAKRDDDVDYNS